MFAGGYFAYKKTQETYEIPDLELSRAMHYNGRPNGPVTQSLRTTPSIDEPAPIEIVPNNGLFVPPTIPQMAFLIDKSMSMFSEPSM